MAATLQTAVFMEKQKVITVCFGSVELKRSPSKKGKNLPLTATVDEIVFRDCADSLNNNLVLQRAVKRLPTHLKKLGGWSIVALRPIKNLGIAVPNIKTENIGE